MTFSKIFPETNRWLTPKAFHFKDQISKVQANFLETYGFLRFENFATKELVQELNEEIAQIEQQLLKEGRTHVYGVPLYIGKHPDNSRYIQRLVFASTFGKKLHAFLQDPRFAALATFAGPDFRIGEKERDGLVIYHYRREPGSVFRSVGWHTDSARDLFYLEKPRRYLNIGFYLDDSPIEKGGLRLIPFSHHQSIWSMLSRKLSHRDKSPDPAEFAIEAKAGDLTIHDGRLWHRVAEASLLGKASQRRVMYLPFMNGPYKPKNEKSKTPLYFYFRKLGGYETSL